MRSHHHTATIGLCCGGALLDFSSEPARAALPQARIAPRARTTWTSRCTRRGVQRIHVARVAPHEHSAAHHGRLSHRTHIARESERPLQLQLRYIAGRKAWLRLISSVGSLRSPPVPVARSRSERLRGARAMSRLIRCCRCHGGQAQTHDQSPPDGLPGKSKLRIARPLSARGESRLAQKPGQPPYFAHREVPSNQRASVAKYGDCPRLLRFGPFCHGLLRVQRQRQRGFARRTTIRQLDRMDALDPASVGKEKQSPPGAGLGLRSAGNPFSPAVATRVLPRRE